MQYRKYWIIIVCLAILVPLLGMFTFGAASGYNEAPQLAQQVKQGKLSPIGERLPANPLVVKPVERIGEYGGTWRMAMLGRADTAILTRTVNYENLVRWSPDWKRVIPNVVESWETTDGGRVFTFHLRKGMKWSDGTPFTADDIMFWYEDVASNKELTPTFPKWLTIDGKPVKVAKVNDFAVEFSFAKPYGLFLQFLACPGGDLYAPKHYMKQFHIKYAPKEKLEGMVKEAKLDHWYQLYANKNDAWMNPERPTLHAWRLTTALGTGPVVTFDRNPYYWKVDIAGNQLPYIDRIVFEIVDNVEVATMKALAGEIDYQDRHITQVQNYSLFAENRTKGDYRIGKVVGSSMNTMVIAFNLNHKDQVLRKIFNDRRFRFAMSLAINRKDVIDAVYYGQGEPCQPSPLPDSPFYYEPLSKAYIGYDPQRANKLLDEMGLTKRDKSGFRLRPDGKPLALTIEIAAGFPNWEDACAMVKQFWEAVGIKTAIKVEDRSLFYTRKEAAEHDVAIWGGDGGMEVLIEPRWYFPFSVESNHAPLWQLWYNTGGRSGEEPPQEVKKQMQLYNQILTTPDENKQIELMKEILKIDAENLYVIGISRPPLGYYIAKNNFRNVPETYFGSWLYPQPAPFNPCQFFIKKGK